MPTVIHLCYVATVVTIGILPGKVIDPIGRATWLSQSRGGYNRFACQG